MTDNTGAIDISNNPRVNDRSKHIDIQYHYVRENVLDGTVTLLHCNSADNLADICTKGITTGVLKNLLPKITGNKWEGVLEIQ